MKAPRFVRVFPYCLSAVSLIGFILFIVVDRTKWGGVVSESQDTTSVIKGSADEYLKGSVNMNMNNGLAFPPSTTDGRALWPALISAPSSNYPVFRSLLNVVKTWNPDEPEAPTAFKETIQHFNYSSPNERLMAERYRNAELPFKLYDVPEIDVVRQKWTNDYLLKQFQSNFDTHVESSTNNHFMYWAMRGNGTCVSRCFSTRQC
jgi:hypothetical protein